MSSTDPDSMPTSGSTATVPAAYRPRPLVSVCIPTRERPEYLEEALRSVLSQDVPDLEVLVFDDASGADNRAVVDRCADPRIVYRRHARPVGIAANRNALLAAARGRYLAWLDDDDAYLPDSLGRQLAVLDSEPDVVLVHGAIDVVDSSGRACPAWPAPFESDTIEAGRHAFAELVLGNYVRAPTVVTRSRAHRAAGPFALDIGDRAEDWDAWLRLALCGDLAFSARPIARYRVHERASSTARTSSLAWLASETRVVHRALGRARSVVPGFAALERRAGAALIVRHLEAATDALARGEARRSRRIIRRAARLSPDRVDALREAADRALASDEHGCHAAVAPLLREAAERLDGTRFGRTLRARIDATDRWSSEREGVAGRIRQIVPRGERVAAIDKWDPSLLHRAERSGWHFPDLELSPEGYPADDAGAIAHLEAQRSRGAEYLVVPRTSFWWLDHYGGFSAHLDGCYEQVWADDLCIIYRLSSTTEAIA